MLQFAIRQISEYVKRQVIQAVARDIQEDMAAAIGPPSEDLAITFDDPAAITVESVPVKKRAARKTVKA
jgi:hypothetical protein